jgi:adenosylcobyric acid synthase
MARAAHGGDLEALERASGLKAAGIIDASANLNPIGPPAWLDAAFNEGRRAITAYPDPKYGKLAMAASLALGVEPGCLAFGNGADELMYALARAFGEREHIVEEPSYAAYRQAAQDAGCTIRALNARLPKVFGHGRSLSAYSEGSATSFVTAAGGDYDRYAVALKENPRAVLWIGAPNNPTGLLPEGYPELPMRLAKAFPDAIIIVDEAFIDFCENADPAGTVSAAAALPNLAVLRSMTKFWCVPGIRAGYAVASAELAARIRDSLPSWPLNAIAEAFARRAFSDPEAQERREETRMLISAERRRMAALLNGLPGVEALESSANYYLVRVDPERAGLSASQLAEQAASRGLGLRRCDNFPGLGGAYLRLAVRSPEENELIASLLKSLLGAPDAGNGQDSVGGEVDEYSESVARPVIRAWKPRAKALMVQGTSSGAGKSLIAAALCRIFRDEGYDVAPYKAQNMSNNSALSPDGLELGRAQAVQAAACGLEPDPRMNPVLLKPDSDRSSQIVLMGKAYARHSAAEYYGLRDLMKRTAQNAYDSLAAEHDLIVLEGAGSPAEINLKAHDFVNMEAARHAGARVLLVGDIDRGGVFASFIGTVSTFSPSELALFSGFIVNKFRGDPALLGDAFGMTRDRTGYPVLGCVPMMRDLDIPDEDEPVIKAGGRPGAELRIAVARLPRVSNFTDLDAFAAEPDMDLIAVSSGDEVRSSRWDAIIIPGSKATVSDLAWLRQTGLADTLIAYAASGGTVVGICGGYQMLGLAILDADAVESGQERSKGLGLLPIDTAFVADKALKRAKARFLPEGFALEGYEIHHGRSRPAMPAASGRTTGAGSAEATRLEACIVGDDGDILGYRLGRVWGSYLHGLFDADGFRRHFLNGLRERRGLKPLPANPRLSLDKRLDALAAGVREGLNLDAIRAELGL